jgi:predicted enzyme related to lactoylglutathione lyase
MAGKLGHFAINADDVPRAKRFYESVFGWTFTPWGPPDFYQTRDAGVLGALQGRRELVAGVRMTGVEATIGVDDIKATVAAVEAGGGRMVMQPVRLEGVGELAFFQDPEGNLMGVMQYEAGLPA